jgi:capsular polysaccharide transport system permease protein
VPQRRRAAGPGASGEQGMGQRKQTALDVQLQVLHALILRDIRTRFGGTMWGYSIVVLWPCAHLLVLITLMYVRHVPAALGDSLPLFIFTGMSPMIVYMYMTRKMLEGIAVNKPLMSFPDVKFLDICISRVIVEILTACTSLSIVMLILLAAGINPVPHDCFAAVLAFCCMVVFSTGIGFVACNIVVIFPPFAIGYALFIILFYGLSGVFFIPEGMPTAVYHAMLWNPVTNGIMLLRSAYYPDYGTDASALYILEFGGAMMLIGLLWERLFTRYI